MAVYTGAIGGPRIVRLATFQSYFFGGDVLTAVAADGRLRAYAWLGFDLREEPDCVEDGSLPCIWDATGGQVVDLVGRERNIVPGVTAPLLLAAAAGRIAVAPSANTWTDSRTTAVDGPVTVLDPATGVVVTGVAPSGTVVRIALSEDALAVAVRRSDGSVTIERYGVPSGALLAATTVASTPAALDTDGKWIIYGVGRQIRAIDPVGGDLLLLQAPARPIGLSIEGRRVAWAENHGRRHRIRAALAPA